MYPSYHEPSGFEYKSGYVSYAHRDLPVPGEPMRTITLTGLFKGFKDICLKRSNERMAGSSCGCSTTAEYISPPSCKWFIACRQSVLAPCSGISPHSKKCPLEPHGPTQSYHRFDITRPLYLDRDICVNSVLFTCPKGKTVFSQNFPLV